MILTYGDVTTIKDPEWYLLELRSQQTLGPTLKRLGKYITSNFRDQAVEIFVPIDYTVLGGLTLLSDCYVFIRTDSDKIRTLRTVVGVAALLVGEVSRKYLKVADAYVRGLLVKSRAAYDALRAQVVPDTFVQVVDGESCGYCGRVLKVDNDGRAQVKIVLRGRGLLLETSVGNLRVLPDVPMESQVYYYCDLIKDYTMEHGAAALQPDLTEELPTDQKEELSSNIQSGGQRKHRSRFETATALVRRLVRAGERDMHHLAAQTLRAIAANEIRPPKTLQVIHAIIKRDVTEAYRQTHPGIRTFRDVLKHVQKSFTLKDLEKEAKALGVPFGSGSKLPPPKV